MRGDGADRDKRELPDSALWRRSVATDAVPSETDRFLDLAGFADGLLDPDERDRVAEWLARDADAAVDVAAARIVATDARSPPEPVIARAAALVGNHPRRGILRFPGRSLRQLRLQRAAGWGSLAAALAVASWLGFMLGVNTSLSFSHFTQVREDGFLNELLDPSAAFARDLPGGVQT